MANIKKIEGKTGTSYKITVTMGRDATGKQIRHYKTWTPEKPMTARQMEKEAQKAAFEFEKELELGYQADDRQTFEAYSKYYLDVKRTEGASEGTMYLYARLLKKINAAIGFLKLNEIRPSHLTNFYKALAREGGRACAKTYSAKPALLAAIEDSGLVLDVLSKEIGISHSTLYDVRYKGKIGRGPAEKFAGFFGQGIDDLFTTVYDPRPLSAISILKYNSVVSGVLSLAEKEMIIPYNPAEKATLPKMKHKEPNYFQPDSISKILDALKTEPIFWETMVHLLVVTGCRRGEILALKWNKIDLTEKTIIINASLNYTPDRGIYEAETKTKSTRIINIPDETATLIRKYRAWCVEQKLALGKQIQVDDYIFRKLDGLLLTPTSVNGWLNRFSKNHKLPKINPHSFRHSAASIMIASGVDIVTVSKMLGHSNTSMTTDVYSHVIEETKRKATECIADVLLRKKKA